MIYYVRCLDRIKYLGLEDLVIRAKDKEDAVTLLKDNYDSFRFDIDDFNIFKIDNDGDSYIITTDYSM